MLFDIYPDLLGEGDQSALFIEQGGRRKANASFAAVAPGEDCTAVVCPLGRCRVRTLMRPGRIGSAQVNTRASWPDHRKDRRRDARALQRPGKVWDSLSPRIFDPVGKDWRTIPRLPRRSAHKAVRSHVIVFATIRLRCDARCLCGRRANIRRGQPDGPGCHDEGRRIARPFCFQACSRGRDGQGVLQTNRSADCRLDGVVFRKKGGHEPG